MNELQTLVFINDPVMMVLSLSFLCFWTFVKPGCLLGLYCSSYYLFSSVQIGPFRLLHLMFFLLLVASIFLALKQEFKLSNLLQNTASIYMIGFLLFLCINYMLFSKDTEEAWSKVKYFFFFAVSPVLFIQMATDGSKILKEFINGYISSCLFISFITLIYVHFDPSKRFFLLNNPITFSIPLATSCIFLLYHLLYSKLTILYRITCAALILGLIFLIIMSGTRQSLFSLIVAFAGFVYLQKGRSIPKIQKVFVWVGFGFFLLSLPDITTSLGAYDRFTTEILSPEAGISVRTMYWSRAFNDFLSSPLLGIGLGSFGEYVMVPGLGLVKESEHNFILEILAESGLIGFGLFCGYYFLCLRSGLRVLMEGIQKDKSLAILFLCTVVFTLSQSMFSGGLVSSGNVLWSASALTAIYRARVLSSTTGVVCEFTPDEQS